MVGCWPFRWLFILVKKKIKKTEKKAKMRSYYTSLDGLKRRLMNFDWNQFRPFSRLTKSTVPIVPCYVGSIIKDEKRNILWWLLNGIYWKKKKRRKEHFENIQWNFLELWAMKFSTWPISCWVLVFATIWFNMIDRIVHLLHVNCFKLGTLSFMFFVIRLSHIARYIN